MRYIGLSALPNNLFNTGSSSRQKLYRLIKGKYGTVEPRYNEIAQGAIFHLFYPTIVIKGGTYTAGYRTRYECSKQKALTMRNGMELKGTILRPALHYKCILYFRTYNPHPHVASTGENKKYPHIFPTQSTVYSNLSVKGRVFGDALIKSACQLGY